MTLCTTKGAPRTLCGALCFLVLSGCAGYDYGNPGSLPPMTAAPYSVALRAAYCDDVFRDERAIDHRLRIGGTWAMGLGVAGVTTGTALLVVGDRSDSEKWTTAGEVTLISGGVVLLGGILLRWLAPAHQRRAENAARLTTEILAASELRSEATDHGRAGSTKRLEARIELDNATGKKLAECFGQDPAPSPEPRTQNTAAAAHKKDDAK